MGVRRLAVAIGPNIFQMLLVIKFIVYHNTAVNYFAPGGVRGIVMSMSVCLSARIT